jgi:hypothetical protein
MRTKLTTEEFIKRAVKKHGERYGYSKVVCGGHKTKVIITCIDHGDFLQTANNHLSGQNCPDCGNISKSLSKTYTLEEFIIRANKAHDNFYSYLKFIYNGITERGIIICPLHGEFLQSPNVHINMKNGCPDCAGNKRLTTEEFIRKAREIHGDDYGYLKSDYNRNSICVIITCPLHGDFLQTPSAHIHQRQGCPACYGNKKLTQAQFIQKALLIHDGLYSYEKLIYINVRTKGIITCPIHGDFLQSPAQHLDGQGCRKCKYKNEQIVADTLTELNIDFIREFGVKAKDKTILKSGVFYCDFYIPSQKKILEYQGRQHYEAVCFGTANKRITLEQAKENLIRQQKIDNLRREHCKINNINLLEIDGRVYYGEKLKKLLRTNGLLSNIDSNILASI